MSYLGNFDEAEAILEKGLLNATAMNDLRCLAFIELYYGHMFWARGIWESAKRHYEICIGKSEEMKMPVLLTIAWSGLGQAYSFLGDQVTAGKNIEKAIKIQMDAGIKWWLALHYVFFSIFRFNSADLKEAQRLIEKGLQLSRSNHEKWTEGQSWIWMGRIVGKSGPSKKDKAEESILTGINILEKLKSKPYSTLGRLFLGEFYLHTGEEEKAMENLKEAEALFREMGMDYWLDRTHKTLARA